MASPAHATHCDVRFDVVVPTVGRPNLHRLLAALVDGDGPRPGRVFVVDDRARTHPERAHAELTLPQLDGPELDGLMVVCSGGRGPAAARNIGWRRCAAPWVVFLDDDVAPGPGWRAELTGDLADADAAVGAIQGRLIVPLPDDRRPTDRERNVAGLQAAAWITADMAVRRQALVDVGGFDERFRRAYREDSDLALRLIDAGWTIRAGQRTVEHPVLAAPWWSSVLAQRGNADDALMRRLHGRGWRIRARAPRGALRSHAVATAGLVAAAATRRAGNRIPVRLGLATWSLGTARFWWKRVAPGPRHPAELAAMAASSVAIPFAACGWAVLGRFRARRLAPAGCGDRWSAPRPGLVLFDRDGTIVDDVSYNGDPTAVRPTADASAALERLRSNGIATGVITNQSGVARGMIHAHQVAAVNRRVEELLGPFATVRTCLHGPDDGCGCRKPAAGMVLAAASDVGVGPERCVVIGDIGSDVEAGLAAGARAILVPNTATLTEEVECAPEVAADLSAAVDLVLAPAGRGPARENASEPDGDGVQKQ